MGELVLKQGLLSIVAHKIQGKVKSLVYQSEHQICTVLHSFGICKIENEFIASVVNEPVDFQWLLYVDQYNLFVGVQNNALHILDKDFYTFFDSKTKDDITCCLYNRCSGDIITAGHGNITLWSFHQGGKTISVSDTITAGLEKSDRVNLIHLEDVLGSAQRCFVAIGNSVKVYHLYSGRLLKDANELHSRSISALLFFRPLQYLITGARDGSIKVWKSTWELFCSFIGHEGPVTGISLYTNGPHIISSSLDSTIQLWDLRYGDTLETIHHTLPVHGIYSEPNHSKVITYSNKQLCIWNINQLYQKTTIIGADCTQFLSTTHPAVPIRLIATCSDSAVRLISPVGGAIITTALLPLSVKVHTAVYKPLEEILYVLTDNGVIKVFDSSTHPCKELSVWDHSNNSTGSITCIALYEVVIDNDEMEEILNNDQWLSVVVEAQKLSRTMEDPLLREKKGFYILLAGTDTGHIITINQSTGLSDYSVQCSNKSPVSLIACNPKKDYILSITNQLVTVWRVYPYTLVDAMVMMMSFDVIGSPSHMSVLSDTVCIAVNDYDKANYSLTVYSILDLTCYSANPAYNHTEAISGLDVNIHLHLFVSCGRDSTVRVWSRDNNILRILYLESVPTSVIFSSYYGNISVSMNSNIYTIQHVSYLNETYLKQLVSIVVDNKLLTNETQRELRSDMEELSASDVERLYPPSDEFKDEAYRGALSQQELDELDRRAVMKYKAIESLLNREENLRNIRDGLLKVEKIPVSLTVAEYRQSWKQVLPLLQPLPRTTIRVSDYDSFDPDMCSTDLTMSEPYEPYTKGPRHAFFPPLYKFDPPYPIAPDGFLPNSILLQKLRKSEEDRMLAATWQPPVLSDRQKKQMEEVTGLQDDELLEEEENEFMNQLRDPIIKSEETSPSPPPSPVTPPKREIKTQMKVQKMIAPKPKSRSPTLSPSPIPSPSPPPRTPTPPPTPLPEYITQFIGQSWFDSLFPVPNVKTFPKPWSVIRFINNLLSYLPKPIDIYIKADIVGAIHKLIVQYKPSNVYEDIYQCLLKLIQHGLTSRNFAERQLIIKIIKLFIVIGRRLDNSLASVFMAVYSEGDTEIQLLVIDYFQLQGLDDPHRYFSRELTTNIFGNSLQDMIHKSNDWIDTWLEDYLRSKGVKITKKFSSKTALATTDRQKSYNIIDVINYFVRSEHEKELARRRPVTPTPPPPEPEEELPRNAVVPLPKLGHHGRLTRLGETHCSHCHPERETTLLLAHHHPMVVKQPTTSWLHLSLKMQCLDPFHTSAEEQVMATNRTGKLSLISDTRLFLIDHSYPK